MLTCNFYFHIRNILIYTLLYSFLSVAGSDNYERLMCGDFEGSRTKSMLQQFSANDLKEVNEDLIGKGNGKRISYDPMKKFMGRNKWEYFYRRIQATLKSMNLSLEYLPALALVEGIRRYYLDKISTFEYEDNDEPWRNKDLEVSLRKRNHVDFIGAVGDAGVDRIADILDRKSKATLTENYGFDFCRNQTNKLSNDSLVIEADGDQSGERLNVGQLSGKLGGGLQFDTLNQYRDGSSVRSELDSIDISFLKRGDVITLSNKGVVTNRLSEKATKDEIRASVNISPLRRARDIHEAVNVIKKSLDEKYPDKFQITIDDENMFKVIVEGIAPNGWWKDAYFKLEYNFNNVNTEGPEVTVIQAPPVAHLFGNKLCLVQLSPHSAFEGFWSRDRVKSYSSHNFTIVDQIVNPVRFIVQDNDIFSEGLLCEFIPRYTYSQIADDESSVVKINQVSKLEEKLAEAIYKNNTRASSSLQVEKNKNKIYRDRLHNMLSAVNVSCGREDSVFHLENKWRNFLKHSDIKNINTQELLGDGNMPKPIIVEGDSLSGSHGGAIRNKLTYKNDIFIPVTMEKEGEVIEFRPTDITSLYSIEDYVRLRSGCKIGLDAEPGIYFKGKQIADDDALELAFKAMESDNAAKARKREKHQQKKHDKFVFINYSPIKNDEYDDWKIILKPNKNMAKRSNFTKQYRLKIPQETQKRTQKYYGGLQYGLRANAWIPDFCDDMETPEKSFAVDAMTHFSNHFLRLPNDNKEWVAFKGNDIVLKSLLRVLSENVSGDDWKPSQAFIDLLLSRIRMAHGLSDLNFDVKQKCMKIFERSMNGFFDNNTLSDFSFLPNYWGSAWMELQKLSDEDKSELRYKLTVNALSEFLVRTLTYNAQGKEVPDVIKKIHENSKDISIKEIADVNETGLSFTVHILTIMDFISKNATDNFSNISDRELEDLQERIRHVQTILKNKESDRVADILTYLYEDRVIEGQVDFKSEAFQDATKVAVVNEFNRRNRDKKDPVKIMKENLVKITDSLNNIVDPMRKKMLLEQLYDVTGIPVNLRQVFDDAQSIDFEAMGDDLYSSDYLTPLLSLSYYRLSGDVVDDEQQGDPKKNSLKNWQLNAPTLLAHLLQQGLFDTDHRKLLVYPGDTTKHSVSDVDLSEEKKIPDESYESMMDEVAMEVDVVTEEGLLYQRVKDMWPLNYINHEDGDSESEPYKQTCQVCKEHYRTMNLVPYRKHNGKRSVLPVHEDCREKRKEYKKQARILFKRMLADRPKEEALLPYRDSYNPVPDGYQIKPVEHDSNVMYTALAEAYNIIHPECEPWNVESVRKNIHENLTRIKGSIDAINDGVEQKKLISELSVVTGIAVDRIDDVIDKSVFLTPSDPDDLETCAEQFGYGDVNLIPILSLSHHLPVKVITDQASVPQLPDLNYWKAFCPNLLSHLQEKGLFNLDHWHEREDVMVSDSDSDANFFVYLIKYPGDERNIPHFDIARKLPEYVGMPESSQTEVMEDPQSDESVEMEEDLPNYHELNLIPAEPTNIIPAEPTNIIPAEPTNLIPAEPTNLIPAGPPTYQEVIDGGEDNNLPNRARTEIEGESCVSM